MNYEKIVETATKAVGSMMMGREREDAFSKIMDHALVEKDSRKYSGVPALLKTFMDKKTTMEEVRAMSHKYLERSGEL